MENKLKWINILTSRAKIKKKKYYDWDNITEDDIKKGKKASYDKPYLFRRGYHVFGMFPDTEGEIELVLYHSFDAYTLKEVYDKRIKKVAAIKIKK